MFLSEGGEEEKARESGKFKAEGDRSQIGGGRKSTWRTCFSRLPLYEYLMQGTKTDAVNSEKVWQPKMLRGERLTKAIQK